MTNPRQNAPAVVDIAIRIGAQFSLSLTCYATYNFKTETGTAEDIEGYVATAHVRDAAGRSLVLDLNPTVTDASNGVVSISVAREITAELSPAQCVWDLWMKTAGGQDFEVCRGACNIEQKISEFS